MEGLKTVLPIHIAADDPLAIRLRDKFFAKCEIVRVPISRRMPAGQCYCNVLDHIAEHGGSMQMGWLLVVRPNEYVEAIHHAVWRDENDELQDLSDHMFPSMTNREISFIEDTQTPAPRDYAHPVIPSWFLILNDDPVTKKYIRQMRLASELHDKFVRNATAAGLKFERFATGDVGTRKVIDGSDPLVHINERLIRVRAEKDQLEQILDGR